MKLGYALSLGVLSLSLSGCGLFAGPPPETVPSMVVPSPSHAKSQWMTVNSAAHSLSLTVIAGYQSHGFNLNGTQNGAMWITVPVHWHVTVHFTNASGLSNSLAVVPGPTSNHVVFPGASTKDLMNGISQGQSRVFSFTPTRTGHFRLASLVPGHEDSGMWAHFVVTDGGKPSLRF
ncbi:MAG: hypothetical protein C7B47_05575 [Sulfobacillus thermosulfidooxidans]|uniref:Sulfocyanin-like C-terminal domain-containing protein n=1 Tax=Sulfobacillus thermosulfidooxidans TaxID=28034 RepID=A0A2T2X113_SULTH|nr:MAG: hypothetical protein C7B47_05575 [Sulfobacillus thermosulfidooxidans]